MTTERKDLIPRRPSCSALVAAILEGKPGEGLRHPSTSFARRCPPAAGAAVVGLPQKARPGTNLYRVGASPGPRRVTFKGETVAELDAGQPALFIATYAPDRTVLAWRRIGGGQ
jgi:hypothetical protein